MLSEREFRRPYGAEKLLKRIESLCRGKGPIRFMEICGTHTMAIAKAGLRAVLPGNLRLVSGPGCPVCVTPSGAIDEILRLSGEKGLMIASYGDLLRVPGSRPGDTLARRKALGARVQTVYSPMEALALAEENPALQVVFLGVGFETTAPGTAAAVMEARRRGTGNFTVFSMLKRVEPALRALIAAEGFDVDGFICPGHVAVITGAEEFAFLPAEYGLPAAVAGFEPEDILLAIYHLLDMLARGEPALVNDYGRAVSGGGNALAQEAMERVFTPRRDVWRGLGEIERSGLALRDEFADFDAERRFGITIHPTVETTPCRCGDVITGRIRPADCPMFERVCTPDDPLGPCMVSGEGACAAAYKYME